uniref:Sterol regulatory element-binding protein cleavage-activating protein n=1 Tax=Schizosaccharomyces pombe (strain 972 / ATCC 24843) TaxID=284812 RepID=UPI00090833A8|nr:Chain I, Sterol regulatory element-binding protein cleavage-activating protein [Schizosaccharomyces pombe 972h-]5GRS_J Chain J, Sterol regulatory element-binding protein cleavage-activating protein [Schizosaccharomyces pombe 972h-]5GRS_K Chain K, Sterol regulatory element-binding protein cleavage-activating protein [Schizosaccharomyces pombe 972h-]5GRS_L Chain L, Sterol regulatory element-binding protein cleavage-activating protein [Schizosaccharomyces pombe 972h-]
AHMNTHSGGETQVWEVWMYSQSEKKHRSKSLKMYNSLIIADPGPSLAVSDRCVAIVLGNYVALVGYGSEIFRDFYQIRNSDEMDRILRRKRKNLQRKRSGTIG